MSIQSIASYHTPSIDGTAATGSKSPAAAGGASFQSLVTDLLGTEAAANAQADQAIQALGTGHSEGLHSVSLAVAQADLSFRLILELRNRLTEAYQEVMRMQV